MKATFTICTSLLAIILIAGCRNDSVQNDAGLPSREQSKPTAVEPPVDSASPASTDEQTDEGASVQDRETIIANATQLVMDGQFEAATTALTKLLVIDPDDVEVLFRLAEIEAQQERYSEAIDLLNAIPDDHPEAGLPALGQSADWCMKSERYKEAEQRYGRVLEIAPNAAPALRQLAFLLNRQGRRHEASQLIRQLCRQGNVQQDELHSLIVLGDAMYDDPTSSNQASTGNRLYYPIGAAGRARKLYADGSYQQAAELLRPAVENNSAPPSIVAFYGRIVVEGQDENEFQWWLSKVNEKTRDHAEYWSALGAHLLGEQKFEEATRALAESLDRDPTDKMTISRMSQALSTVGDEEGAQRMVERFINTRDLVDINNRIATSNPPNLDAIDELVRQLRQLDRPLEAMLWKALQAHYRKTEANDLRELSQQLQPLLTSDSAFPTRMSRLCGIDVEKYPLPKIESGDGQYRLEPEKTNVKVVAGIWKDIAEETGLRHTYRVESKPRTQQFSIHQTLGGGVAALDYNLDGQCDLYLAQGGADAPMFRGSQTNALFRQVDFSFRDVTAHASATEFQYSIGVTVGDWNQDGFPDLAIANIGTGTLLINNGDGTFSSRTIESSPNLFRVPTSLAIADLNGDHLPDIFQTCYVDDEKMANRPSLDSRGNVTMTIAPNSFDPAQDWIANNDGQGGFDVEPLSVEGKEYAGLGIVVTDFDAHPGNEIFVGNDTYPNRLWKRSATDHSLLDTAPLTGSAYSYTGGATGAMGIATGDFDRSGTLDIHIANYENEDGNLYLSRNGAYRDRNIQYQLGGPTRRLVGFGTQAMDYDNDGWVDLVITNGHLDNANTIGGTYPQPLQVFYNLGHRFQLISFEDQPGYCGSKHVGRGLAKLDFNRDGRTDFIVTHVEQPTALLVNETPTNNHWIQFRLVGTECERDAIGAKVTVQYNNMEQTDWITAGDGYLSSNEKILAFGIGNATSISEVSISWPSGSRQSFKDLESGKRWLLIEDEESPFELPE